MLIFWKARLVLFAVPKTGTTALEAALAPLADVAVVNPPGLKHCSVARYRRELSGFLETGGRPLELMALMREPTDWLGSWYRYRGRAALAGHARSTRGIGFDAFVRAHLERDPPAFARVGSQATFLAGGVDHLFRYETFDAAIHFLSDRLGHEIAVERRNVSPGGALDLSPVTRARLERERAADYDLWKGIPAGVRSARVRPCA